MKTKRCSKCKETKPVSEFYKNRRTKDGLASYCQKCDRQLSREFRDGNKEKIAEMKRRYYEANKDREDERKRRWYEANREQDRRRVRKKDKEVNARSLELAHRHRCPWEDWEDDFVLADNGLTEYQKAIKLGRSRASIGSRRQKLRKKKLVMS